MQPLRKFPDPVNETFAILCQYPELSLHDDHSRQCLVAARSLQTTHPQFGLILFLTSAVWIHRDFQEAMDHMNVQTRLFEPIVVPAAAHLAHAGRVPGWAVAYQKLTAWSFSEFTKVLILDSDSVVLDNIDWAFSLPGNAMGSDCLPHYNSPERYWVRLLLTGLAMARAGQLTGVSVCAEGLHAELGGAPGAAQPHHLPLSGQPGGKRSRQRHAGVGIPWGAFVLPCSKLTRPQLACAVPVSGPWALVTAQLQLCAVSAS